MNPSSKDECNHRPSGGGTITPWRRNLFHRLPWVGFCMLIFWHSSGPSLHSVPLFPHDDKVIHALVYAMLALFSVRLLEKESWAPAPIGLWAFLFSVFYGIFDEIHQSFVPGRDASALDVMADTLGAWAAVFFLPRLRTLANKSLFS